MDQRSETTAPSFRQPINSHNPLSNQQGARAKLQRILGSCQCMRSELNSIKALTLTAKRKMDLNVKSVRDMIKNHSKSRPRAVLLEEDKENDPCGMNRLKKIEVSLPLKVEMEEQSKLQMGEYSRLNQNIRLQLQEIRLIEQRENLIRKKNERMSNYYSENKRQLELKRSQVQESE